MSHQLESVQEATFSVSSHESLDLLRAFLEGRNPRTLLAYKNDLIDFNAFKGGETIQITLCHLLSKGHGPANGVALAYRANLQERGLSAATINRRIATLRSVVKLARILGLIPWHLETESLKSVSYRDTRGPGLSGFQKMLESLENAIDEKAVRDRAILRLLFGMALRRGEVASLDLCHLDQQAGRLAILGKGHSQRESLTIPPKVLESLKAWVAIRGDAPGALFHALDHAHRGHRLDGSSIYRMISSLGKSVGMKVRPHGLRHAGITTALDVANGNARAVQRFSRHARLDTLHRYDDNRADLGGQIAYMVDQES